jgi:transcriptional regulator with XRE-family HTH domain
MALGEILKNARVQRGLTPSDVAENTHMMVQVVEDLEREDFRRVAAPIYGRGFVKLYAEMLELDPEPLIRDFMELYSGTRVPAVRTKKVESQAEPAPESVPVTRTVSGTLPQRQAVQPRPAVRPLSSVPQPVADEAQVEPELKRPQPAVRGLPTASVPAAVQVAEKSVSTPEPSTPMLETGGGMVVEPEAGEAVSDEPDLFRPQPPRRQSYADISVGEVGKTADDSRVAHKSKLPIFKIGGRMEEKREPSAQDEAAHARRRARIQAFVDGVTKLKDGVESKLPSALPYKRLLALGGMGLASIVVLMIGIHMLLKKTGTNVKVNPNVIVKIVAPPPDLYVD